MHEQEVDLHEQEVDLLEQEADLLVQLVGLREGCLELVPLFVD